MPSDEFKKYLNNLSDKDKNTLSQNTQVGQEVDKIPDTNSNTPNPADAGKPVAGVEDTGKPDALAKYQLRQEEEVKDAGQTLEKSGVTPSGDKGQEQDQQQDQGR
jgi:hypothetical protein